MSITRTAAQVPVPMGPTALIDINAQEVTTGASVPPLRVFAQGDLDTVPSSLNRNAAALASVARFGGGGYGIVDGLEISIGTGLLVDVAAGQAIIDGPVPVDAAATIVVPDATANVYLWLLRDGTFEARTALTHPSTPGVLLGCCTTSGGAVTAVDDAGRCYLKGGVLWRETADAGVPADSPGADLRFLTKTTWGQFLWNGATYEQLVPVEVMVFDLPNLRVGINNQTPAERLDIIGHARFSHLTAPGACTGALAGAGAGNVDNGAHIYKVTFVNADGETEMGTASNTVTVTDKTTNGQVALSGIPTGPTGTTSRKVYRTLAGGTVYYLLTTIADNVTTVYTDNTADGSLGALGPLDNTTAGTIQGPSGAVAMRVNQNGTVSQVASQRDSVNKQTLSATLTLTTDSPRIQVLDTGGGGGQNVVLPSKEELMALGDAGLGVAFRIQNWDSTDTLTLKSAGGTTVASITAGDYVIIESIPDASGDPTWPNAPRVGPTALPPEVL